MTIHKAFPLLPIIPSSLEMNLFCFTGLSIPVVSLEHILSLKNTSFNNIKRLQTFSLAAFFIFFLCWYALSNIPIYQRSLYLYDLNFIVVSELRKRLSLSEANYARDMS